MLDPELVETVDRGDVKKLIELCESRSDEFFIVEDNTSKFNVLHILCVRTNPRPCVEEILTRLSIQVVSRLICQTNEKGQNAIHVAAANGLLDVAAFLVDAYMLSDDGVEDISRPPWRAKDNSGQLPVQMAVGERRDEVAAFLISVDPDVLLEHARSLLSLSVLRGCKRTANTILTIHATLGIPGFDPSRITDAPDENCSESDAALFVKYLDYNGRLVIFNQALRNNSVDIIKTLLDIDISLPYKVSDDDRHNPLHIATKHGHLQIAQALIDASYAPFVSQVRRDTEAAAPSNSRRSFEIEVEEEDLPGPITVVSSFQPLWRQTNTDMITPLHIAFLHGHEKLATSMLLLDLAYLCDLADEFEAPPPIDPIIEQQDFKEVTELYLESDVKHIIMDTFLEAFLQLLTENKDCNKVRKLIIQHPKLTELQDASGRAILQYAQDNNGVQAISTILGIQHPAVTIRVEEQEHLLTRALRTGNVPAISVACDIYPACDVHACGEDQTTVLHNVRLQNLDEYRALLKIEKLLELKNITDARSRSPLIKAIDDREVKLVEALLEVDGIDILNIRNKEGKTAADMLKVKSKESDEWDALYKKMKQHTSFIPLGTDLKEMRNTLSVVSALLSTITFAAAFTVPGGFDQNNGHVLLGQKTSFIVFLIADTYAMCCSMIVLFSLIWSMVWDSDKAIILIDKSVYVLRQSLFGTLVAFMTGVYTVMSHKSMRTTVAVCVISSCVTISASRRLLVAILDIAVPSSKAKCNRGLKVVIQCCNRGLKKVWTQCCNRGLKQVVIQCCNGGFRKVSTQCCNRGLKEVVIQCCNGGFRSNVATEASEKYQPSVATEARKKYQPSVAEG